MDAGGGGWNRSSSTPGPGQAPPLRPSREDISAWLVAQIAQRLDVAEDQIDVWEPFTSYGLASRDAVLLTGDLELWLGESLSPTLAYDYPTVDALARYLAGEHDRNADAPDGLDGTSAAEPIAIIGLGCRFPGASDPDSYWRLLRDGIDAIREVPPDRWDVDQFYHSDPGTPGRMSTRWGGFLDDVDLFDASFFGISPREAASLDPQQRLLLEVTWEALENAGQASDRLARTQAGVFVGISSMDYSQLQAQSPDYPFDVDTYVSTGNAHSLAANRISYALDLRGPSVALDTACSSSLVALHLACRSLRDHESDLALAAGVNLILEPSVTISFSHAHMMALDGRCKTFDARGDGYVRGEGAGVVVLKRLSDALQDGDVVYAVVRGSAVNQDGRTAGITAPSGLAQQAVVRAAAKQAGIAPRQLGYVEAHGTGTALGDPIEMNALAAVLGPPTVGSEPCWVSSVKTNIGHLEAAAGIAGVIKVVLSLTHEIIPPHLHLQQLNPRIALEGTRLAIPTEPQPWPRGDRPRFAGVSSFGFGGTNAHIVIEEPPEQLPSVDEVAGTFHMLTLSAKTESSLKLLVRDMVNALAQRPGVSLADLCFSANIGRARFNHRVAAVSQATDELATSFAAFAAGSPTPTEDCVLVHRTGLAVRADGCQALPERAGVPHHAGPLRRDLPSVPA